MKRHLGLLRLLPLTAVFILLAGCGEERLSALDPYGPQAEWILDNMILSLYVMALVVIVVFALYFIAVVKFRKKPGDEELPEQVEGSKALELTWTIIPVFLLAILAVPTIWGTYYMAEEVPEAAGSSGGESENGEQNDEGEDSGNSGSSSEQQQGQDALVIDVTGHQFWWQFDYPEGFSAGNEVYIPTNEKVWFNLTSNDVIHSFWVPALGGKIDTIPGVENTMWLEANEPGVYKGKCAELCGPSHALMDFKVIAMEPEEYEAWESEMASGSASSGSSGSGESGSEQESSDNGSGEGASTVSEGRQAFENQGCITCHAVEGQGTGQGPTLSNFGDREKIANILEPTDENLEDWIRHPGEIKQGNNMPPFPDMNDEDMNAIVQYLQSLSAKENMNQ